VNPHIELPVTNLESQTHRSPDAPARALKGFLVKLMQHYPQLQGDQIFRAIEQLRCTFSLLDAQDVGFRTSYPVETDQDLSLTI
jgi:hypothetical protein